MTIHPKYINRRYPKREYVLVHKSKDFNGRLAGVKFTDGQSDPVVMKRALCIAGPCGGKMQFGFCLDTMKVFGDCSPQEHASILEAAGMELPAIDSASMEDGGGEPDVDEDGYDGELHEDGSDRNDEPTVDLSLPKTDPAPPDDEDEPYVFTDQRFDQDDVHHLSRAFFEKLTKPQIDKWAQDEIGLTLDGRLTKPKLIDQVLAHSKVVELPSE